MYPALIRFSNMGMYLAPIRLQHYGVYLAPIITAFGYLAPITAFGNCFLANDVMESGGCAQGMTFEKG